ncbi:hypothetical protein EW146_g9215 [Bondarzewia mesenterica]|uniref:Uncharacterized protein n=1 Tax=Bondarzewia mesenterica TaxID=1095465 RepID=A0A4S4LA16_9AGAM|nr:hypothetical protein EW146_g9215 [Bondarzewia mesenterica]
MRILFVVLSLLCIHASRGLSKPLGEGDTHSKNVSPIAASAQSADDLSNVYSVSHVLSAPASVHRPSSSKPRVFVSNGNIPFTQADNQRNRQPIYEHRSRRRHSNPIVVAFAVLGGIFGLFVMVGLVHCALDYHRAPHRDTSMTAAVREQLIREMQDYAERAERGRRHILTPSPPPAYERPPSYVSPPITDRLGPEPESVLSPHLLRPQPVAPNSEQLA